ncbi:proenkephalin-B [Sardina pilchardus]|uniref:proenkephalin-B n=1 Tax=Sardina pilchardus TaxID=27697 RepID=UPI002E11C60B
MERYVCVLVLILSAPVMAAADCASRCLRCAQELPNADTSVDSLACTLECEGAVTSSWELNKCDRILKQQPTGLTSEDDAHNAPDAEDSQESSLPSLVKRYGGFIKRIDKNKLFKSPWYDNAVLKGLFAKKFGEPLGKFGEREVPELAEDTEREDVASESETGVYDDAALNPVKRYGGFLRKFPKRSESSEETGRQELQKRYGGFMRRIRPKLRWDNQKRYGGFLRRHFKISVRSEEDPAYDDLGL